MPYHRNAEPPGIRQDFSRIPGGEGVLRWLCEPPGRKWEGGREAPPSRELPGQSTPIMSAPIISPYKATQSPSSLTATQLEV